MKILPARQKAYIANPDKGLSATLLFGPNISLSGDLAKKLIISLSSGLNAVVDEIQPEALKENPAILAEKLSNFSLFDDPKVYFIPNATDTLSKLVEEVIEKIPDGSHMIVTAGDLSTKSSLRNLFEKQDRLAGIGCYDDDNSTLAQELRAQLLQSGKSGSGEAIERFLARIAYKRYSLVSEVQKLVTYLGEQSSFDELIVDEIISNNETSDFSDVSEAILASDYKALSKALIAAESEGMAAISVLRGYLWFVMRLLQVRAQMDDGILQEQAMKSLYPPVFFKNIPAFRRHLQNNSTVKLLGHLDKIVKLERQVKFQSIPQGSEPLFAAMVL